MDNENWYRQLLALVLLSASRAAVDYITNPSSRENATNQLRQAFAEIDYDAAAKAVTSAIDQIASTSKDRLNETIDTLRDRSVDAVDDAKSKAEKQLGQKKGGRKMRFIFGLIVGGLIAYFMFDEQRRDELLDRLTGASGPIQQSQSMAQQASSTAEHAANRAVTQAANATESTAQTAARQASETANQTQPQNQP